MIEPFCKSEELHSSWNCRERERGQRKRGRESKLMDIAFTYAEAKQFSSIFVLLIIIIDSEQNLTLCLTNFAKYSIYKMLII